MNSGLEVRPVPHVLKVSIRVAQILSPIGRGAFFHVVGGEASARLNLGDQGFCIVDVPVLVRIDEHKVKRPWQILHQLMGIGVPKYILFIIL